VNPPPGRGGGVLEGGSKKRCQEGRFNIIYNEIASN